MKKLLMTTACALGVSAAPAFAADLPTKKDPIIAPFTWTGCYVGGLAGVGFGQKNFSDQDLLAYLDEPPSFASAQIRGGLAGGQVGCNYQFATNWVVGAEGMAAWANIRGTSDPFFGGKAVFHAETQWLAAATGRVGYAIDRWLVYAKGGAAWAGDKYSVPGTYISPFDLTGSGTRPGWTIGAGVEWAFWQNWSVDLEYDYYDFGTRSLTFTDVDGSIPATPASIRQEIQTVTLALNWRF
jgi:outer membrane immunogenic protein